jgi:hypothetical protein
VPSKKQRRRRQKERRHDYEYVYVDAEGQEVEVADDARRRADGAGKADSRKKTGAAATGRARTVQPPSWRRVFKRGLIFAPLMFITVVLIGPKDATTVQRVTQTLFLLLVFLPFSYVMDSVTYRIWRKRLDMS